MAVVVAVAGGAIAASQGPVFASWSMTHAGTAGGAATVMPTGARPSGAAGTGAVTVSWASATLGGGPVSGYIVRRYNAVNGTLQAVGGTCAGTVTATTCTDQPAPPGTWIYTDTPVQGSWHGGESVPSPPVVVN